MRPTKLFSPPLKVALHFSRLRCWFPFGMRQTNCSRRASKGSSILQSTTTGKQHKIAEYYKKQERLLKGFNEMETIHKSCVSQDNLTEDELKQLAKSERMAINVSNVANLFLFVAKVYASIECRSLAVIASTMNSFLDLLSGLILWFTSHAMRNPNQYHYPIGKKRMQPEGIIVFASIMATLGLQIILESVRQLIAKQIDDQHRFTS